MKYTEIIREWNTPLKERTFWTVLGRKLTAYEKRQTLARELAIQWQYELCEEPYDFHDQCKASFFFEEIGRKYGLLREFKENGIC